MASEGDALEAMIPWSALLPLKPAIATLPRALDVAHQQIPHELAAALF